MPVKHPANHGGPPVSVDQGRATEHLGFPGPPGSDEGGGHRAIRRNRRRVLFLRMVNRAASILRPRPASGKYPVPTQMAHAREWHLGGGRHGSIYTPVAPMVEGVFPQEELPFPHPAASEDEWLKGPYQIPPAFVLEIRRGRTMGRHGAVLTPDHVLLRDLSREFFAPLEDHPLLHEPELPEPKRLRGRYALVNGPGNSSYHWLFDVLPRLEVLRRAGYALRDFDGFLMTQPKYEAHYATLDRLGIPREKITWCKRVRHFECDELVVPSFANNEFQHHPFVYPFLQSLRVAPPGPLPRQRLYISRHDAVTARRDIVNEEELTVVLERFGFRTATLADLSFQEQANLFASAEVIVSPHGGGLANLCFCEPGTKVIELFASDYAPAHYRSLSRQLGLEYQYLFGEAIPSEKGGTANGGNIRLDPGQVETILKSML